MLHTEMSAFLLSLPLDVFRLKSSSNCRTQISSSNCRTQISSRTPTTLQTFPYHSSTTSSSASVAFSKPKSHNQPLPLSAKPHQDSSTESAYRHFESLHQSQTLKRTLFDKLRPKDSDPLQILNDDGDWSNEIFWGVINFLKQASRSHEILKVFYLWKSKENSRTNEVNYEKIIGLLVDEGLVEDAVSAHAEMKNNGLSLTLEIYNSVIHGFTRKGRFEDAMFYLKEMEEIDLRPESETFDGFIQAYGKYKMYDEMSQCVEQMESYGCLPDYVTYNLLIREFAQAGLLTRMERTNQILISKRMDLQSSTLLAMLEAYANFGILDKMQKFLQKVLKSKTPLDENLIRKIASIYIDNHMFSRVDELGIDLSSKLGKTDLVWCLRLLSHACNLSRKGMNSIVLEMEADRLPWNVTIANILLLAYLKMKDFKQLNIVLSELPARYVKPDIVTVGIVVDAYRCGFDGTSAMDIWRRIGFLDESVEMNTDALVLTSFGKGRFLKNLEEVYSSLESNSRKGKVWTYRHLINLVVKHKKQLIN